MSEHAVRGGGGSGKDVTDGSILAKSIAFIHLLIFTQIGY